MGKIQIGVISDTHGLLRPQAVAALEGSQLILHAGDIGNPEVLAGLGRIAPVVAIRGNNDRDAWASNLPETSPVEVNPDCRLYMLHNLKELRLDPVAAGYTAVISGHSHKPSQSRRDGVLYLNPGSAGPRRFKLPVSLAVLYIEGTSIAARLYELDLSQAPAF